MLEIITKRKVLHIRRSENVFIELFAKMVFANVNICVSFVNKIFNLRLLWSSCKVNSNLCNHIYYFWCKIYLNFLHKFKFITLLIFSLI